MHGRSVRKSFSIRNRAFPTLRNDGEGEPSAEEGQDLTASTRSEHCAVPDIELVERAQAGDRGAFAELYQRHAPAVARLAQARGHQSDVDDAVAETFARAWKSIRRFRDRGIPFRAWLYGIARNVVADRHRASARTTTAPIDDVATDRLAVQDRTDGCAALVDLGRALGSLNRRHRKVIELKYLAGLTNEEIGRAMGIKPGAVNAIQWRALDRLRTVMGAP